MWCGGTVARMWSSASTRKPRTCAATSSSRLRAVLGQTCGCPVVPPVCRRMRPTSSSARTRSRRAARRTHRAGTRTAAVPPACPTIRPDPASARRPGRHRRQHGLGAQRRRKDGLDPPAERGQHRRCHLDPILGRHAERGWRPVRRKRQRVPAREATSTSVVPSELNRHDPDRCRGRGSTGAGRPCPSAATCATLAGARRRSAQLDGEAKTLPIHPAHTRAQARPRLPPAGESEPAGRMRLRPRAWSASDQKCSSESSTSAIMATPGRSGALGNARGTRLRPATPPRASRARRPGEIQASAGGGHGRLRAKARSRAGSPAHTGRHPRRCGCAGLAPR